MCATAGRFLAQLALRPRSTCRCSPRNPTHRRTTSHRHHHRLLRAWLTAHGSDEWTVIQGGPVRLWDHIEQTVADWRRLGAPAQDEFTLIVTADKQAIRVETNAGDLSWQLPDQ